MSGIDGLLVVPRQSWTGLDVPMDTGQAGPVQGRKCQQKGRDKWAKAVRRCLCLKQVQVAAMDDSK